MLQEAFSPQKKSVEVSSLHWHFHACVLESMKIKKKNCQSTEGENRFWKGYKENAKLMTDAKQQYQFCTESVPSVTFEMN